MGVTTAILEAPPSTADTPSTLDTAIPDPGGNLEGEPLAPLESDPPARPPEPIEPLVPDSLEGVPLPPLDVAPPEREPERPAETPGSAERQKRPLLSSLAAGPPGPTPEPPLVVEPPEPSPKSRAATPIHPEGQKGVALPPPPPPDPEEDR